jgi:hypothetical protein
VAPDAKRALLLQQILRREIGLGVALRMVAKSVQRQGLRRSAQMLAVALRRLASKRVAS